MEANQPVKSNQKLVCSVALAYTGNLVQAETGISDESASDSGQYSLAGRQWQWLERRVSCLLSTSGSAQDPCLQVRPSAPPAPPPPFFSLSANDGRPCKATSVAAACAAICVLPFAWRPWVGILPDTAWATVTPTSCNLPSCRPL